QQRRKMTLSSPGRCSVVSTGHGSQQQDHRKEHNITVMLIAVVIFALVCQMPTAVLLLYSTFYEPVEGSKTFYVMRSLGNIFNLLNAVNAAANFILYCAFSTSYRRTFVSTLLPCLSGHGEHTTATALLARDFGKNKTSANSPFREMDRKMSKKSENKLYGSKRVNLQSFGSYTPMKIDKNDKASEVKLTAPSITVTSPKLDNDMVGLGIQKTYTCNEYLPEEVFESLVTCSEFTDSPENNQPKEIGIIENRLSSE
ncbi:unnamed protein product, partial [Meganyctiphanes norvegica]